MTVLADALLGKTFGQVNAEMAERPPLTAAGFWNEDQPRAPDGRWGEGGASSATADKSPTDRIKDAIEYVRVDIERLHPDVQEQVAKSVEKFAAEFPGAAAELSVIRSESNKDVMRAVGQAAAYVKTDMNGVERLVLNETNFGKDAGEYALGLASKPSAIGDGVFTVSTGDYASTIDHELGHILYERAERSLGRVEDQDEVNRLLLRISTERDPQTNEFVEKGPSARAIASSLREVSQYGAKDYLRRQDGAATHRLSEGFSEWFAARQNGMEGDLSPLLRPAWEKIMDTGRQRW